MYRFDEREEMFFHLFVSGNFRFIPVFSRVLQHGKKKCLKTRIHQGGRFSLQELLGLLL